MNKPTPRPWTVRPVSVEGFAILEGGTPPFEGFSVQLNKADAVHIAHSVNMHEHLIKAVKFALAEFERISYQKKAKPQVVEFLKMVLDKAGK